MALLNTFGRGHGEDNVSRAAVIINENKKSFRHQVQHTFKGSYYLVHLPFNEQEAR